MFKALSDHWFLTEPALFALYCQQQLEENVRMDCAVRCGQGRLEYNPLILAHKNFMETEQLVRIELIRLFLKHPYEREPDGCSREAMTLGSNVTIADGYCLLHKDKLPLHDPAYYHLPLGQYYEWYVKQISQQQDGKDRNKDQGAGQSDGQGQSPTPSESPKNSPDPVSSASPEGPTTTDPEAPSSATPPSSHSALSQQSALWRDDSLRRQQINELIERTSDWGTMPADIVERIKASTHARIDNRMIWQGFRSAILSEHRRLTRMRPNRRTGFLQMGSTRRFNTRLLVAVDVSGSITEAMLQDFFSAVNHLVRYGIAETDLCQFDAVLGEVKPLQQARTEVEVHGRGGTNFQPVIDHASEHREYDGLIILTDGQAPAPSTKHLHIPLLWVCSDRQAYEAYHLWMKQSGRCCHL